MLAHNYVHFEAILYIRTTTKSSGYISSSCRPSQISQQRYIQETFTEGRKFIVRRDREVSNTLWATDKGNDSLVGYYIECISKVTKKFSIPTKEISSKNCNCHRKFLQEKEAGWIRTIHVYTLVSCHLKNV